MRSLLSILLFTVLASFSTEVLASVSLEYWLEARESTEEEKRELQERTVELANIDKLAAAGGAPALDCFIELSSLQGQWIMPENKNAKWSAYRVVLPLFQKEDVLVSQHAKSPSIPLFKRYQAYIFYG